MMIIRDAILRDLEQVLVLTKSFSTSFAINEGEFRKNYPVLLENRNSKLLVAELDKKIVGYCLTFNHLALFSSGYVAWVEELVVDSYHRNKGIGRRLIETVETDAKNKGYKLIALATRRAMGFYLKLNYEESAAYFRKII